MRRIKIWLLWKVERFCNKRKVNRWTYPIFRNLSRLRADLELLERLDRYFCEDKYKRVDDISRDDLIDFLGTALLWQEINCEYMAKMRGEIK